MVLAPEPVFEAVERWRPVAGGLPRPLLLLSASGRRFDQGVARELAADPGGFSLLCGRYEGVDQRVADHLCDGELSIGDFVLAGGELAALVVVEAVARLLPGVLGNEDVGRGRELLRRPPRVPPVHPAGRVPGLARCPTCCAPATTAGSRRGAGRSPWSGPCSGVRTSSPPGAG